MNYEKQLLKQVMEQPDYISDKKVLQLVRGGYVRVEKSSNTLTLGPLFFHQLSNFQSTITKLLEKSTNCLCQKTFQTINQSDLLEQLKQIRTVKTLPLLAQQPLSIMQYDQQNAFDSRTQVEEDFLIISETQIDQSQILNSLNESLQLNLQCSQLSFGSIISSKRIADECPKYDFQTPETELEKVHTPDTHTILQLAEFLHIDTKNVMKAVMYQVNNKLVFVHIRGDLEVDDQKLKAALGINPFSNTPLAMADDQLLVKHSMVGGYCSLVNAKKYEEMIIIFDQSTVSMNSAVVGANETDYHFKGFNYQRDLKKNVKYIKFFDIALRERVTKPVSVSLLNYGEIPLNNSQSKLTMCKVYKLTVRYLDLLYYTQTLQKVTYFSLLIKNEETKTSFYSQLQQCLFCCVVDERPKITNGQKKELADSCGFQFAIIGRKFEESGMIEIDGKETTLSEFVKQ